MKKKENYSLWGTKAINKQVEDKIKPAGIQTAQFWSNTHQYEATALGAATTTTKKKD